MLPSQKIGSASVSHLFRAVHTLWTPDSSWELATPHSPVSLPAGTSPKKTEDTVFEPFETILSHDLAAGTLAKFIEGGTHLKPLSNEITGEEHVYFRMLQREAGQDEIRYTLRYPVLSGEQGISRPLSLSFSPKTYGTLKQLYVALDKSVVNLVWAMGKGSQMYRNATQKVVFKSESDGGIHTAYFKFGDAFSAERKARVLLRHFGLSAPAIVQSEAPGAYWVAQAPGESLQDILKECEASNRDFSDWIQDNPERASNMAFSLGKAIVAMYVLGNDDGHAENVIVDAQGNCQFIDLEALGLPFLPPEETEMSPGVYLTRQINFQMDALFQKPSGNGRVGATQKFAAILAAGAHETFGRLRSPEIRDAIAHDAAEDFLARGIIRGTMIYLYGARLYDAIPHYTFPVSGRAYADFINRRIGLLNEVVETEIAYYDDVPSIYFMP